MSDNILYYQYREPEAPLKSEGFDLVGFEYRNFILRIDGLYLFWQIKTKDGSPPPTELSGNYTTQSLCKESIDDFLRRESQKQKASNVV